MDQDRSRPAAALAASLAPLRRALVEHPVYAALGDARAVRIFMEHHVYAVWDFMSLLTRLQRDLTCVAVPWTPPADPAAARLVNEIVLGEETDLDGRGGYGSHLELYLGAMEEGGADTRGLEALVDAIAAGTSWRQAVASAPLPPAARAFVATTLAVCEDAPTHAVASFFLHGREDLIPDMFREVVARLDAAGEGTFSRLLFYLDRHIEVDDGEHGPAAARLLARLCGEDPARWREAGDAARRALEARRLLWDAIGVAIAPRGAAARA